MDALYFLEDSHSGLVRSLGKRVWVTPPGVRISYPPPLTGSTRYVVKKHVVLALYS